MNEIEISMRFLKALAKSATAFESLFRRLRSNSVVDVFRQMDCYQVGGLIRIDEYVEGTVSEDCVLCYWFEIEVSEFEFNIEASLLRNKYSEQELLVQFAKSVNTLADFDLAVEEMMNRLLELDIEQYK